MNEQKLVKKQLLKNMILTLIAFSVIFTILGLIIYNQVTISLYRSTDEELIATKTKILNRQMNRMGSWNQDEIKNMENSPMIEQPQQPGNNPFEERENDIIKLKINPRLIYVIRDEDGNILNADTIGRFYDEYLTTLNFDKNNLDKIYNLSLNNEMYKYRGITFITTNSEGQDLYVQLFANIEAEENIIQNFAGILGISIAITIILSILVSYILSQKTLKPIITSWNKQTEFVQNASHELRTPLTIIQAKQELLLRHPDKKIMEKSEEINLCLKETRRLTKLIKDLMMLARADSNEIVLNKEKIKIDDLIKEVAIPYIDFAGIEEKEIKLNLNFGREITVDRAKFHQLLVIILDNAIKYTEPKDTIEIATYLKEGKFNLEVKDTGIGISKEGMKHAFDRFYREDKARSRQTGGAGLGLSLAHYIVTAHGGTIKLLQNEPKGTIVYIRLKNS